MWKSFPTLYAKATVPRWQAHEPGGDRVLQSEMIPFDATATIPCGVCMSCLLCLSEYHPGTAALDHSWITDTLLSCPQVWMVVCFYTWPFSKYGDLSRLKPCLHLKTIPAVLGKMSNRLFCFSVLQLNSMAGVGNLWLASQMWLSWCLHMPCRQSNAFSGLHSTL